jgi:hypothetical protein
VGAGRLREEVAGCGLSEEQDAPWEQRAERVADHQGVVALGEWREGESSVRPSPGLTDRVLCTLQRDAHAFEAEVASVREPAGQFETRALDLLPGDVNRIEL